MNISRDTMRRALTPFQRTEVSTPKLPFEAHFLDVDYWHYRGNGEVVVMDRNFFEVIWVKKGRGTFMVDFERFSINDNTLYCLFPGQLYFLEPEGEMTGYRIAFSSEFLSSDHTPASGPRHLTCKGLQRGVHVLHLNDAYQEEIEKVVRAMVWEYQNHFQLKFEILKGYLKIFVAYFSRQFELDQLANAPKNSQIIFRDFLNLVDDKFRTHKLVSEYAFELSVTANYLSEVVKRTSGNPASYYVHQRILLEAKRMLATSDASMKEIAFDIGFEDPSQFSKFFKFKCGRTFTDFRRNLWQG